MDKECKVIAWIQDDELRMEALHVAASMNLNDWCLAAGFVRNLIWDKLHGYQDLTPLNDIDLVYYDKASISEEIDLAIEQTLILKSPLPWSVKNQARMHTRNNDSPYTSVCNAMRFWVEVETAIGVRLSDNGDVELVAPFGLESCFSYTVTVNPKRVKLADFEQRVKRKRWLELWPGLKVINA